MTQRPSTEELEAARQSAIAAIKGYQGRALQSEDLQTSFHYLLKSACEYGELDWFEGTNNYHGLMMELLKLVSDPEINSQLPEWYRKRSGKMLVELAGFFGDLKHNHSAEAELHLYQVEKYAPSDLTYLQNLAAEYRSKTEDCRRETVVIVG